jgi:N-acetylglucosamine kinase-like BadF-type ATPase
MIQPSALVLAVDGGQTSTLALVATYAGQILGAGLAGPSNHFHEPGGPERLERALSQSITAALRQAQCTADQVTHVCLGMTGAVEQAKDVVGRMLPGTATQAHFDMVTALAGASIAQPGVVVIAGTGSIAYGRLENGRDARAGGWGYLIGDEGSAYQIGRGALRAASHAADRRGPPTTLLQRIPEHFRMPTLRAVRDAVYTPAIQRPQIAALAAVVAQAAYAGDQVAAGLLDQAGRDLAAAALAVIAQLDMQDSGMNVYTTGGAFRAGRLLLDPFKAAIRAHSAASSVHDASFSPVIGALFLALQATGSSLSADLIESIRRSLPQFAIEKY